MSGSRSGREEAGTTGIQVTGFPLLIQLLCRAHHEKCWLEEAQAGIKIAGRNINNLRYADDTTLMAESKEELKSLLMKVKEESGKSWLKTQYSKN